MKKTLMTQGDSHILHFMNLIIHPNIAVADVQRPFSLVDSPTSGNSKVQEIVHPIKLCFNRP